MWRDDAFLLDILLAARKVVEFTHNCDLKRFRRDEVLQHAVMRLIQIIGEAAGRVSREVRDAEPGIPWGEIIGMRHRLVHDYSRIDVDRVWEVVQQDIPDLIQKIEPLVPPPEPDGQSP